MRGLSEEQSLYLLRALRYLYTRFDTGGSSGRGLPAILVEELMHVCFAIRPEQVAEAVNVKNESVRIDQQRHNNWNIWSCPFTEEISGPIERFVEGARPDSVCGYTPNLLWCETGRYSSAYFLSDYELMCVLLTEAKDGSESYTDWSVKRVFWAALTMLRADVVCEDLAQRGFVWPDRDELQDLVFRFRDDRRERPRWAEDQVYLIKGIHERR